MELAVHDNVDLLVVEGDEAGDRQQLTGREVIAPGEVGVYLIAGDDRPALAGPSLVRTGADGFRPLQVCRITVLRSK
jgi:hypothetical protein